MNAVFVANHSLTGTDAFCHAHTSFIGHALNSGLRYVARRRYRYVETYLAHRGSLSVL